MKIKNKIFFIGPLTEKHGQGRVSILTFKFLEKKYDIQLINTHINSPNNFIKLIFGLTSLFKILYKFLSIKINNTENITVYFTPSRNFISSLRDFFLLICLKIIKSKCKNLHIIGHLHGADLSTLFLRGFYGQILKNLYKKNITKMIVNSESHKKFALGRNFLRYAIIDNPINFDSFDLKNIMNKKLYSKGKIVITFISGPSKLKGLYESILFINKTFKTSDWIFNVVGWTINDFNKVYFDRDKLDHNSLKKIKFLGRISDKEKEKVLISSNIFILLSYTEAQPLSVIEAGTFKCAIILSNIDMLLDFKKYRSIVYNNNPNTNEKKLLELIKDKDILNETFNKFLYKYSLKNYEKNLLKVFSN